MIKIPHEHMGDLYQLRGKGFRIGDHYPVNGPYDSHGVVMAIKEVNAQQGDLLLIRGTGHYQYGNR